MSDLGEVCHHRSMAEIEKEIAEELAERDMSLSSRIQSLIHHIEHTMAQTQACMWDAIHDLELELAELKSTVQVIQNYVCDGY